MSPSLPLMEVIAIKSIASGIYTATKAIDSTQKKHMSQQFWCDYVTQHEKTGLMCT